MKWEKYHRDCHAPETQRRPISLEQSSPSWGQLFFPKDMHWSTRVFTAISWRCCWCLTADAREVAKCRIVHGTGSQTKSFRLNRLGALQLRNYGWSSECRGEIGRNRAIEVSRGQLLRAGRRWQRLAFILFVMRSHCMLQPGQLNDLIYILNNHFSCSIENIVDFTRIKKNNK